MLKELLYKQQTYTNKFFSNFDCQPLERLIDILLLSKGVLFCTGVGKSGLIAKKIALTLVSTGTRAFYICPTDAVHGDLGMLGPDDVFLFFSKSGASEELMHLAPAVRNKGATLVAIVCTPDSSLSKICHLTITLPFESELCPFDLAPTMSTAFQLLFGDLLTIALMKQKKFSLEQYALNHPSGRIGKRITLRVRDIMLTGNRVPLCQPHERIEQILVELSNKRCGCILIVDENNYLLGIFTDGDLRRQLARLGSQILTTCISDIMTQSPQVIGADAGAWEAMQRMENDPNKRVMMLPVVNEERQLLGLLHLHDLVQSGL